MAKQPNPKVVTKKHLARLERERIQQRYLMIGGAVVLALILVVVLIGIIDQTVLQPTRPVARVGSDVITTEDFQSQVRFTRYRLIQQLANFAGDPMMAQFFGSYIQQIQAQLQAPTELGQQVLDRMIEDQIIIQEAAKMGITVSDEEVNKAVEQYFGYYANGTPTPEPTATAFSTATLSPTQLSLVPPTATPTESLPTETVVPTESAEAPTPEASPTAAGEATATPDYTPTPLPTPTEFTREGYEELADGYYTELENIDFTREELRQILMAQLLREKVLAEVTKDVQAEAEQVWARHILVATEEEAQAVRERLLAGEDFAAVAAEVSTDESNKNSGGDLGWFTRERMVEAFSNAAFELEIGEISEPVESSFGYHVIQVLGHETRPLSEADFDQAKQTAFSEWLETKKTEKQVETFDRWIEVVPSTPAIPPDLLAAIPQQQSPLTVP